MKDKEINYSAILSILSAGYEKENSADLDRSIPKNDSNQIIQQILATPTHLRTVPIVRTNSNRNPIRLSRNTRPRCLFTPLLTPSSPWTRQSTYDHPPQPSSSPIWRLIKFFDEILQ